MIRLWMILVDAIMAKGTTKTEPIKEPSSDIFMASNKGGQIWGIHPQSGGNISFSITKNSLIRLIRTLISKPVTSTESAVMASKTAAARGALDLGLAA